MKQPIYLEKTRIRDSREVRFQGIRCHQSIWCRSFGLALLVATCVTGEFSGQGAERFELTVGKQRAPEMGLITVCSLLTDRATYSFVPPHGWRVSADSTERKVSLVSSDNALITLQVAATPNGTTPAAATGGLQSQVLERYSAAKFVEEMPCFTAAGTGQAFDFLWSTGHGVNFKTRYAVMSAKGERIEIVLTSKPETFAAHHYAYSSLLNSFQIGTAIRN